MGLLQITFVSSLNSVMDTPGHWGDFLLNTKIPQQWLKRISSCFLHAVAELMLSRRSGAMEGEKHACRHEVRLTNMWEVTLEALFREPNAGVCFSLGFLLRYCLRPPRFLLPVFASSRNVFLLQFAVCKGI